ncbi:hypothetical protein Tco_0578054 [Tanacetum coccineum]
MVIVLSTILEEMSLLWISWISKPSPRINEYGDCVKLSDLKQALRKDAPSAYPSLYYGLSQIFEASRARSFVLRSQELQILSFIWEIQYPNLIELPFNL